MIMDVRIVIMTVKKETGRQIGVARMTHKTISHVSCAAMPEASWKANGREQSGPFVGAPIVWRIALRRAELSRCG